MSSYSSSKIMSIALPSLPKKQSKYNVTSESLFQKYTETYFTLMKNKTSKKYISNNNIIEETFSNICTLLKTFPKVVNKQNQEQINTVIIRMKNTFTKVNSPVKRSIIFSKISNTLFDLLLTYTGYNMIIENVKNNEVPSENFCVEDIYHLFNDMKPVVQVCMLSSKTFLIEFLNKDDAKEMDTELNDMMISYNDDNEIDDNNSNYETIKCKYIETLINTRKNVFEWSTKNNIEHYYYHHHNLSVPLSKIIEYSEGMCN